MYKSPCQFIKSLIKGAGGSWNIVRKIDDGSGQSNGYSGTSVSFEGFNLINRAYGKTSYQDEVSFLNFK